MSADASHNEGNVGHWWKEGVDKEWTRRRVPEVESGVERE